MRPPRVELDGDTTEASRWISFAKSKLDLLQREVFYGGISQKWRKFTLETVEIFLAVHFEDSMIRIVGKGAQFIIICYVGELTGDFSSKRFYNEYGKQLGRDESSVTWPEGWTPSGWKLTDDGKYGLRSIPPDPDNPWGDSYAYVPTGGIGVPPDGSGIAAKYQLPGRQARYILNGSVEDETWQSWLWTIDDGPGGSAPYTYNFLQQVDSLTFAPLSYYGPKPFFSRYIGDQIVSLFVPWYDYSTTYVWRPYFTHPQESFLDLVPIVNYAWKIPFPDGGSATGVPIPTYGSDGAIIAAAPYLDEADGIIKTRLVHGNTFVYGGYADEMEPVREEILNMDDGTSSTGTVYGRVADAANDYYRDPWNEFGTLNADIKLLFGISSEGKKTYLRIQQSGDFTSVNTGLYCADQLIEECGWRNTTKLHETDKFGPIIIHPVRYRILQSHMQDDFNVVVYSKTVPVSNQSELLPYNEYHATPALRKQVRKTMVESKTTYHISVNGVITDLGYSNNKREYKLTITDAVTEDPGYDLLNGAIQDIPWVDANYDAAGNYLGEDNSVVMRCFLSASAKKLFIGFDVFPLKFRHDIVYTAEQYLVAEYDTSVLPYPPASDARYPDVKDRKWMLFGLSGERIRDIIPPQKDDNSGHVRRINGAVLLGE